MGYCTSVTGRIGIEPPLTWAEIQASPFRPDAINDADLEVCLDMAEEKVNTDEGELIRRTADGLLPRWEDAYKAYHLVEHVQKAIEAFPGHTFSGRLDCEGEDNGDMWRVIVRDGKAVRIEPRIIWPDEDA